MYKILRRAMSSLSLSKLKKKTPIEKLEKPKKKIDRFDGLTEEEVQKYTLSDYLEMNLDIVFVGINPSLMAAHRGRYYAGPGNHFYKLLHESGLTPRFVSFEEDYKLLQYSIGLTNIVARATRSSAELKRTEIKEGATIVEEKLRFYKPKVAVFNGKCIYEVFANKTGKFNFGLQPERVGDTAIWVIPSSSARCANFPRMVDKLHFYVALKKYVQFLKGEIKNVDVKEFWFEGKCKQFIPSTSKMWRRKNVSAFLHGGRIANKDTVCLDTSEENVAIAHSTEFVVKEIRTKKDVKDDEGAMDGPEIRQNTKKVLEQERLEKYDGNRFSQEEATESIDRISCVENNKNLIETACKDNMKYKSVMPVAGGISHRKKIKLKRLSPKSVKTSSSIKPNSSSDFVSLIKQRLQEKSRDNVNSIEEGELKEKQIEDLNTGSKSKRFASTDTKENVNVHDPSPND